MDDYFLWLQNWYKHQCNGDWEHRCGIHFNTLDRPGWSLSINLEDTELAHGFFEKTHLVRSQDDWLECFVKENKFEARCGLANLKEVLQIFHDWSVLLGNLRTTQIGN
ncbi:MAG: hypothetical protein BGO14_00990 [Chlamydiales bacterium 38-26]|nr:immunity 53 family protein [Chlamydiales bacterium]OJV07296.1 MAG: hypothetical protein BGO14_00990 [Chlamydiales bacterium 38-26]